MSEPNPDLDVRGNRPDRVEQPLASLLRSRPASGSILVVGMICAGLTISGLPGWECPLYETIAIPCPGCGLSRALGCLIAGDVLEAVHYHLYVLALPPLFILLILGTMLPGRAHKVFVDSVARFECRTKVSVFALVGIVVYWLVRLLLFRKSFVLLLQNC